jgi:TadE-like protein
MLKIRSLHLLKSTRRTRGQSFLELALVLPILLLMLMGLIEVAFFIGHYLDALDLTREAARFGSVRSPFEAVVSDLNCFTGDKFNYYWDTACIFSPPDQVDCEASLPENGNDLGGGNMLWWCNGMNQYLDLDPATDDIVVSLYTIQKNNTVAQTHPFNGPEWVTDYKGQTSYYWAFSNHKTGAYVATNNWQGDCEGNVDSARTPYYTQARVEDMLNVSAGEFPVDVTPSAVDSNRGFIAVEVFFCHNQVLGLPVLTDFVPDPLLIHAYTIMPLPAAAPTATPKVP